jgi:hypothetical protein
LSIVLFVFVLCLLLPVYLDCPLFCLSSTCVLCFQFIWIVHCVVGLRPVTCVGSLSGLSIGLFVFVLCLVCTASLSGLSIVLFVLVLCLVCTASLSGLSIVLFVFVLCLVLPVYLDCPLFCLSSSCVLCALPVYLDCPLFCLSSSCVLYYQFIWIVLCFVCLRPVSCVASLSGLSNVLFVFVVCLVLPG